MAGERGQEDIWGSTPWGGSNLNDWGYGYETGVAPPGAPQPPQPTPTAPPTPTGAMVGMPQSSNALLQSMIERAFAQGGLEPPRYEDAVTQERGTMIHDPSLYSQMLKNYQNSVSGAVRPMINEWSQGQSGALDAAAASNKNQLAADKQTALASYNESAANLMDQANNATHTPLTPPITVPTQAPAGNVNNVSTNPALSGGNAAIDEFYTNPESNASRYNIVPSIPGGTGNRNKRNTATLGGESDTLGQRKKDDL